MRKKDGEVRWCVDYRKVNEATQKDAYPLLKIEVCLDTLSGSKLFSTVDLLSGYISLRLRKRTDQRRHSSRSMGCNAPSTFQRGMEQVLRGLQWVTLLIYLDDVIITGKTFKEHLNNLGEVLSASLD